MIMERNKTLRFYYNQNNTNITQLCLTSRKGIFVHDKIKENYKISLHEYDYDNKKRENKINFR